MGKDKPVIIDVEASGLGRESYPIEVGFILANEETHCRLIRPEDNWNHWDESAERLHGITPGLLTMKGISVEEAANFLNDHLAGQQVYSDAWGNDSSWLGRLFDSAKVSMQFRLETIRSIISEKQLLFWEQARNEVLESLDLQRHRASSDARVIQATYMRSKIMAKGYRS